MNQNSFIYSCILPLLKKNQSLAIKLFKDGRPKTPKDCGSSHPSGSCQYNPGLFPPAHNNMRPRHKYIISITVCMATYLAIFKGTQSISYSLIFRILKNYVHSYFPHCLQKRSAVPCIHFLANSTKQCLRTW